MPVASNMFIRNAASDIAHQAWEGHGVASAVVEHSAGFSLAVAFSEWPQLSPYIKEVKGSI